MTNDTSAQRYHYQVYGVTLASEVQLGLVETAAISEPIIELRLCTEQQCQRHTQGARVIERDDWYRYAHCADGSLHVSWADVGQFLVSGDGSSIACLPSAGADPESWQVYLLGQALSIALIRQGLEPLHATAVELNGKSIALVGESGFGKSTLAAELMRHGCRLVTDDLLVVRLEGEDPTVLPGPRRLKLFPEDADRYDRSVSATVRMNPLTHKLIVPVSDQRVVRAAVPLSTIYLLPVPGAPQGDELPRLEAVTGHAAFLALTRASFNRYLVDPARLERQLAFATKLSSRAQVKRLSYARRLDQLPKVAQLLLSDSGLAVGLSA